MEEEKDQLIKRVERLKKRVSQTAPRGLFALPMLGRLLDSLRNENRSRHILSASRIDLTEI